MTATKETVEQRAARMFTEDIASHMMHVELDQGVYRHLKCRRPGTSAYHFAITTWPGHLAVSGDMGTWVFARLPDMFEFFRSDRGRINLYYWGEKLVAPQGRRAAMRYSPDIFRAEVLRWANEYADGNLDLEEREQLLERVRGDVLSCADNGEHAAHDAARDFEFYGERVFEDFWEVTCREYDYAFVWVCHAIVWAIQQYDARQPVERAA